MIASVVPSVGVGNNMPLLFPDGNSRLPHMPLLYWRTSIRWSSISCAAEGRRDTPELISSSSSFPSCLPTATPPPTSPSSSPASSNSPTPPTTSPPSPATSATTARPSPGTPTAAPSCAPNSTPTTPALYGLTRDELRYILDPADVIGADYPSETFRVLKNNEIRQFGEYRTRRLVLEAWDRLAASAS